MTLLAVLCALLAAGFFSSAVVLQHGAVRAVNPRGPLALRTLGSVVRAPGWLGGTLLAVIGSALHLTALSLAPLPIVQPLGVLSLVLTVVVTGRAAPRQVRVAVAMVCGGIGGFVGLAALGGTATPVIGPAAVQPAVLFGLIVATAGLLTRERCLVLSASAAVLFGLGSAVMQAASQQSLLPGAGLAAEGLLLLAAGGWLMHRAYAAGPATVVVGATTVLDPVTAVAVGVLAYGEVPQLTPAFAVAQIGLALVAVAGVLVLAGAVPDSRDPDLKELTMPNTAPGMRILIAADTFPPDINGAAHFADRHARGLAKRGHDVHVVCPAFGAPGTSFDGEITVHRVRSLRMPFHPEFRFCTPRQAARAAGSVVDRIRPDVVHVQSHFTVCRAVLAAAAERGVPTMATNHFMPENLLGYVRFLRGVSAPLIRWAWRDAMRVYRNARMITTPTPRAAEVLAENGLPAPARVISCGIDIAHYAPAAAETPAVSTVSTVSSEAGEVSVLFVGRVDSEKNIDQLIRAIAPVPGVRADIVGDGTCRRELEALAASLGVAERVTFHGIVSDAELVRRYRQSQLFCMPGTVELQSLATMEAMAAGLPVLAADALALPHLVYSGLNGYLFEPGDVVTLSDRIAELAADAEKRAVMGAASRQVIARHDIAKTFEAFEDLYRTLTGAPAAAATDVLAS